MHTLRLVVLLIAVLVAHSAHTQSFNSGKNRKSFKSSRSQFPHHGFGFKLGDPFALSYKFYGSKNFACAVDIGTLAGSLYNRYFRSKFNEYVVTDTFKTSTATIDYLSHKVSRDIVGEVKFLYVFDSDDLPPGVQPYLGAGWQWRDTDISYTYLYNSAMIENIPGSFSRRRLTMGPQITGGLEFGGFKFPLSAFIELEYFRDVQVDPGYYRIEGGVGLRYHFR